MILNLGSVKIIFLNIDSRVIRFYRIYRKSHTRQNLRDRLQFDVISTGFETGVKNLIDMVKYFKFLKVYNLIIILL